MTQNPDACPVGTCASSRRAGQLMCPRHWSRVPQHLQREVYRTWRAWRQDLADADAMLAYRSASDAAVAAAA